MGRWLLPDRQGADDAPSRFRLEGYFTEVKVLPGSDMIERRIDELESELRHAPWQGAEYAITVVRALFASESTMAAIVDLSEKDARERSEWIDKAVRAAKGLDPRTSEAIIVADKTTPYRLLMEVLYTLGQSEFSKYHLQVLSGKKK